jgi:chromosome segregation ATPase
MTMSWEFMSPEAKIDVLNNTIDDLRSIKVEQGRQIARLERQLDAALSANGALAERIDALEAQNASYAQAYEDVEDATGISLSEFLVGKIEESREACDEFLASVDEVRKSARSGDGEAGA